MDNQVVVLIHVDEQGFEIEPVIINLYDEKGNLITEFSPNLVPPNEEALATPKWNFDLLKWEEGDTEKALMLAKYSVQDRYLIEKDQAIVDGFDYNGNLIGYSLTEQQQLSTQIMMFYMRPTLTSAKWLTLNKGYQTFTKLQFFEIFDLGEVLKVNMEDAYTKLFDYVNSLEDIETVKNMPSFKEAISLIK